MLKDISNINVDFGLENIKISITLNEGHIKITAENTRLSKKLCTYIELDKVFPRQITGYTYREESSVAEDLETPKDAISWLMNDQ